MVHPQQDQPVRLLKKLLISLFLICSSALIYADDQTEQIIGPFGTLNNRDTSATIADTQAQDLLNVDLTPGGKSFKKRKGYGQAFATAVTTSPIHGTYDFFDSNGNDIALAFNDTYLTTSISGASPVSLFSNGPFGATYQCTDSQGFAYCADTARDRIIKTDGITVSNLAILSTGTMVTVTPDRLVQAGFASAPNRIDFSAGADFTSWATGVLATSPFQFTITAPGSGIKHITYAFNRVMWFKDSSFGYILPGATAADWVVKTISPIIGTLDNSSVYYQDILYFRSQDGNFYSYDGSSLQKISKEIAGTISNIQKRISNSWTQTTQADWAAGNYDTLVYVDTETVPGNLQTLFPDTFDTFRQGNGTKNVWSIPSCDSGMFSLIGVNSGELQLYTTGQAGGLGAQCNFRSVNKTHDVSAGATFFFQVSTFTASSNLINYYFFLSTNTTENNNGILSAGLLVNWKQLPSAPGLDLQRVSGPGFSYTPSTIFSLPSTIKAIITSSKWEIWMNGVFQSSGTHTIAPGQYYMYWMVNFTNVSTSTAKGCTIDNFNVFPQTFTYQSPVKNAAALTSFDTFAANYTAVSGSETFALRSSSVSFLATASSPSWVTIVPGSIPSISTGTFFQVRDIFNVFNSTSGPLSLNDFTQNWFEGNANDKAYATYFNDRIWWSVALATGTSSYNNRVLIYDLLNPGWLVYDIPINGFFLKNLSMYFGSSISGNIYKYGTSDNDNGAAINAYWKSKDYIGPTPFQNEEIRNLSVYGLAVINSTVTVTYTLNEGVAASYNIPTYRNGAYFFNSNRNLPLGLNSNSFNVKIGNNAADQPFEIIAERVGLNSKPWNPTNQ